MSNDTETIERRKSVTLPSWTIEVGKGAITLFLGLCVGYAKFVTVENVVHEHSQKVAAQETLVNSMDRRLSLAEANQSRSEKDLGEGMTRIESQLKELRQDVKDLEKKVK